MCCGCQSINIISLALGFGSKLIDQRRHQRNDVIDHLPDLIGWLDAAIQYAIKQILNGPGQLTDDQRTNHPPTTLEGVERTTHFTQRMLVFCVGTPAWQLLANGFQNLCGFLDEDFQQILVYRLLISRRRQQTRRNILGRRIDGCNRSRHHLLKTEDGLGFGALRRLVVGLRESWQGNFWKIELGYLLLAPSGQGVSLRGCTKGNAGVQALFLGFFGQAENNFVFARRLVRDGLSVDFNVSTVSVERCLCGQLRRRSSGSLLRLNRVKIKSTASRVRFLWQNFNLIQRVDRVGLRHRLLVLMPLRAPRCITKVLQTLFCHVENEVSLGATIFGQALQVILDAGDRVSQRIQTLPVRHSLAGQ